jgi:FdhD protein
VPGIGRFWAEDVKGVTERPVTRIGANGDWSLGEPDSVAVEEPLEIRVSGEAIAITMRTPGHDQRLAVGFLFSEGIIRSVDDVGSVAHCGRPSDEGFENVIEMTPAPGLVLDIEKVQASRRGTLTTAACGVCGRRSVDDLFALCGGVPPGPPLDLSILTLATERLREAQMNFSHTGGTHAAAALARDGELLASYEDVGRHNAVDKVVGELVLRGQVHASPLGRPKRVVDPRTPAVLVVSGRASFEIVQKATVARIPIIASVSAASSLAIDLAERSQIALAAFVRGGNLNVYTHPERIHGTAR